MGSPPLDPPTSTSPHPTSTPLPSSCSNCARIVESTFKVATVALTVFAILACFTLFPLAIAFTCTIGFLIAAKMVYLTLNCFFSIFSSSRSTRGAVVTPQPIASGRSAPPPSGPITGATPISTPPQRRLIRGGGTAFSPFNPDSPGGSNPPSRHPVGPRSDQRG